MWCAFTCSYQSKWKDLRRVRCTRWIQYYWLYRLRRNVSCSLQVFRTLFSSCVYACVQSVTNASYLWFDVFLGKLNWMHTRARTHTHGANRIFGLWKGDSMVGKDGHDVVSAGLAIYGPCIAIKLAWNVVEGAHEVLLIEDFSAEHGSWIHIAVFSTVNEANYSRRGAFVPREITHVV